MSRISSGTALALAAGLLASTVVAQDDPMVVGLNGYAPSSPLLTIGETLSGTTGALNPTTAGDYTPVGILDGLGAYELDEDTVRVFANHELLSFRGYEYEVSDGMGGTFGLVGARVSYFDIDKATRQIVDSGIAYDTIYDGNGDVASDDTFLQDGFPGFSRFCSSGLFEAGTGGLVDTIYFTGEEDGGFFNPVGGAEWALDVVNGEFWQVPALGRGAWENLTVLESGDPDTVAILLADDQSPFDFDDDGQDEAAPMYLYLGTKDPAGNFLERNGLADGTLHVWVADDGTTLPSQFNGSGSLAGTWVPIDNAQDVSMASENGSTGFDEYGFPTQGNLWIQAENLLAFGFSRPEDVATDPFDGTRAVLASTGVDNYDIDASGNGADTFGTLYLIDTDFSTLKTRLTVLYDGDADPNRFLRSPDNLDWADDGAIYVQEDKAEDDTLTGEPLFGPGAANPNEAGIVRVDPVTGGLLRVANVNRDVVLDGSLADPTLAVDVDAGDAGEWETSGILDVSILFGEPAGTLFLFDVQAHGIEDQDNFNPSSRINDSDLVEGGQLLFLELRAASSFADRGNGLAGSNGVPMLGGTGTLQPNTPVTLSLSNALENAPVTLVIGLSEIFAPFKGGVLVPAPDALLGFTTNAAGAVELANTFPAGLPSGTTVSLQFWVGDAGAALGFAASNALGGTTP